VTNASPAALTQPCSPRLSSQPTRVERQGCERFDIHSHSSTCEVRSETCDHTAAHHPSRRVSCRRRRRGGGGLGDRCRLRYTAWRRRTATRGSGVDAWPIGPRIRRSVGGAGSNPHRRVSAVAAHVVTQVVLHGVVPAGRREPAHLHNRGLALRNPFLLGLPTRGVVGADHRACQRLRRRRADGQSDAGPVVWGSRSSTSLRRVFALLEQRCGSRPRRGCFGSSRG
jgi:hypothetical protein